jgi:hypothetical protein
LDLGGRKFTEYREPYITCVIKSSKMRLEGACGLCGEKRNVCRVFMGKSERKRLLGKHAYRREDNIKMDLK